MISPELRRVLAQLYHPPFRPKNHLWQIQVLPQSHRRASLTPRPEPPEERGRATECVLPIGKCVTHQSRKNERKREECVCVCVCMHLPLDFPGSNLQKGCHGGPLAPNKTRGFAFGFRGSFKNNCHNAQIPDQTGGISPL